MRVEILLTENELSEQFQKAITDRNLPEKFFYWFPLCVKAWLDLCSDGAYRNFIRSYGIISNSAAEIAARLPREVEFLSLGCGQGNKDIILLRKIVESGKVVHYSPLDSSLALLELACCESISASIPYTAWKADVTDLQHLKSVQRPGFARLIAILGNTLGGFSPVDFSRFIHSISVPGDFLLVDGEIQSNETTAGYDNPLNRRFAFAPLAGIGISEQDGQLVFESREDPRRSGLFYLTKHFKATNDIRVVVAGSKIHIRNGERLEMNFSCKYSRETFLNLLTGEAGFQPISEFYSDDRRFLMILASRL